MANDPHWIEHAQIKKGAYGHHSEAQMNRDIKKGGRLAKRARLAKTFASLRHRAGKKLYGKSK
jgi:hypothetical protein